MTHTPGPWSFSDEFVLDSNGWSVADPYCRCTADTSPGEIEANARLIAAAPTMLDALYAVQDDYRELMRQGPNNEEADAIDAMLQIVDAAIAKATAP